MIRGSPNVSIIYGEKKSIVAHKIVLATYSREFQTMLAGSPKVSGAVVGTSIDRFANLTKERRD